ncbi:AAA family ATPase [Bacillus sp. FJAT-22090]|uniref:AAA family ATPase n=1 Tax=Bacillus sp. FJAT-22090 TaxID=1581038 RepID=UPI0011A2D47A|nr:AAA family ATPase [Bacillus sp. FJAT-22090]
MKIYIIGSVGSGKTTLARKVSSKLQIPHFETDNFVWTRHPTGDKRNEIEVRDRLLHEAIGQDNWVIEGVHIEWTDAGLREANQVIFLDIPMQQRTWRILKRYSRQLLKIEQANYKPTFSIFRQMFKWNKYFEEQMKPVFLRKFTAYEEKVHCLQSNKQIEDWLLQTKRGYLP